MLTSENRIKLGIFSSSCHPIFSFFDPVYSLLVSRFDFIFKKILTVYKTDRKLSKSIVKTSFILWKVKKGKNMPPPPRFGKVYIWCIYIRGYGSEYINKHILNVPIHYILNILQRTMTDVKVLKFRLFTIYNKLNAVKYTIKNVHSIFINCKTINSN